MENLDDMWPLVEVRSDLICCISPQASRELWEDASIVLGQQKGTPAELAMLETGADRCENVQEEILKQVPPNAHKKTYSLPRGEPMSLQQHKRSPH